MIAFERPAKGVAKELLLVEGNSMIGSIILSTARQLNLHPIRVANNCQSAQIFLENQIFCGLITSLEEAEAALTIIQRLRLGQLKCAANMPVAVTTTQCDVSMANRIKALNVQRILLKPFKIRDLILTIQTLTATPPDDILRNAPR